MSEVRNVEEAEIREGEDDPDSDTFGQELREQLLNAERCFWVEFIGSSRTYHGLVYEYGQNFYLVQNTDGNITWQDEEQICLGQIDEEEAADTALSFMSFDQDNLDH